MSTPDTKPLKIGHIMPYPGIGGTEHATLRMAKITETEGYQNHFLLPADFTELADFYRGQNFPVHFIDEIVPSIRHFWQYYSRSKKVAKIVTDLRLDLIHAADYGSAFNVSLAAKMAKIPLISHVRNRHSEISERDKLFLRLVDHWLFVSASTRDDFALNVSDEKSHVLYDGIRIEDISAETKSSIHRSVLEEFGFPDNTLLIGSLARIAHQKDHLTLAKAVNKLKNDLPQIKVLAVGHISKDGIDNQNYTELMSFIENSGLGDSFILTGLRSDAERLVTAFDVHVLATHFEGFPLVNLEAMAKKTPVIATAISGIPEAINDGVNGFLVEHKNESDLAEKLNRLLSDKAFSLKIGEAGYEYVKENFSSDRFRERILDIYKKVLKK